jgi:hypothetical protein
MEAEELAKRAQLVRAQTLQKAQPNTTKLNTTKHNKTQSQTGTNAIVSVREAMAAPLPPGL